MLEWIGFGLLVGLTGNWRGYRMGGKAYGSANMSTDMKKKFEQARASGDVERAKAMADKAQQFEDAKKAKSGGAIEKWGDGSHGQSIGRNDRAAISAYAKKMGISETEANARINSVFAWSRDKGYERISRNQSEGKPDAQAKYIEDYLKSASPYKGDVYRGTALYPGETVQDLVKRLEGGSSSLKSWSSAPGIAEEFAFGALAKTAKPGPFGSSIIDENVTPVILRVVSNKTGASIQKTSFSPHENEVLVGKGAKYRVVGMSEGFKKPVSPFMKHLASNTITLDLEEI